MMSRRQAITIAGVLLAATSAWGQTTSSTTTTTSPRTTTTTLPLDADKDGVLNPQDKCPGTPRGEIVDRDGCSVTQLCPCDAPRDASKWRSHGQYTSCVRKALQAFKRAKRMTPKEVGGVLKTVRKTQCGARAKAATAAATAGKLRCCLNHKRVSSKPFCAQTTARACTKRHGKSMGAGSCSPNPCQ